MRQNELLTESNFIIQRLYTRKAPFTAILNLRNRELYEAMLKREVIHIGSAGLLVYRYAPVRTCMKCLQFEHEESECPYDVTWCARCGEDTHVIDDCDRHHKDKIKPCCRTCALRGERWTTHMATSPNCPYRLDAVDEIAKKLIG